MAVDAVRPAILRHRGAILWATAVVWAVGSGMILGLFWYGWTWWSAIPFLGISIWVYWLLFEEAARRYGLVELVFG